MTSDSKSSDTWCGCNFNWPVRSAVARCLIAAELLRPSRHWESSSDSGGMTLALISSQPALEPEFVSSDLPANVVKGARMCIKQAKFAFPGGLMTPWLVPAAPRDLQ